MKTDEHKDEQAELERRIQKLIATTGWVMTRADAIETLKRQDAALKPKPTTP